MESILKLSEIRKVSILLFLQKLGYKPTKLKHSFAMFYAPYRKDNHPTLRVNIKYNRWLDYGTGKKGDIIELGKLIFQSDNIEKIVRKIWRVYFSGTIQELKTLDNSGNIYRFKNIQLGELEDTHLLSYMDSRGIDIAIAGEFCKEIQYHFKGKQSNAIAFGNISGGFEIITQEFKGTIGTQDITFFKTTPKSSCCMIFEKMIDFLSYLSLNASVDFEPFSETMDYIILNSLNNYLNTKPYLKKYEMISCCLSNDENGKEIVTAISSFHESVHDMSSVYKGYLSFNDFIRNKPKINQNNDKDNDKDT